MTSLNFSCLDDYDPNSLSVDRARRVVLDMVGPVTGHERVFVRQALGRVLAGDVISPIHVPSHDNSAMDGYAVRHADLAAEGETRLKNIGTAFAGRAFDGKVSRGEALRIMTGAVLPEGVDCVVIQEVARVEGGEVIVPPGQHAGQNLRRAGEDLRAGEAAVHAGMLLRPAEIGIIASLGVAEVAVRRRVRVALFSTGDELCSIGTPLFAGAVYDSNRYTLWGMLTRLGCEVIDMGVVKDQPDALEKAFKEASACADAVITSGGVSVGEADFIKQMLNEMGEVLFWKIAMKPGRPMAVGKVGDAYFFGLPGNPVAVTVTFYQFVRAAIATLQGRTDYALPPTAKATLTNKVKKLPGRTEFQRGVLTMGSSGYEVRTTGDQGSGILSSMVQANCFVVLSTETGNVEPGSMVDVQMFEGVM